ncbi:DUF779 domain-containing protein [Helicobacter mesocricetorum]|uniref:DUF779 domain-containing protein n=1 Tax=Helicobacter mesocricetorum TaxID=87012 RepID=UPI000CF0F19C|nr:DUF779 domain-containing protein [Helicobacter mesocricetorum]
MVKQVIATQKALELIQKLKDEYGELLFHLSGGCCDGSVPNCYQKKDFKVGAGDELLGEIGGVSFYIPKSHLEYYKHSQLIINAKEGYGSEYSLEYGSGEMFVLESRLLNDEEIQALQSVP